MFKGGIFNWLTLSVVTDNIDYSLLQFFERFVQKFYDFLKVNFPWSFPLKAIAS